MSQKRFYLSQTDKKFAGVCGGLAEYFDIDPLLVRVVVLFFIIFGGGGLLFYIVLALLAPKGPEPVQPHRDFEERRSANPSSDNSSNTKPNQDEKWGGSHYDKG